MAIKTFLFGLDRAGKTYITNFLIVSMSMGASGYKPTLGFNVKDLSMEDLQFQIWDAPGQAKLRKTWKRGYTKAELLVFILDVADRDRFQEARETLKDVLDKVKTKKAPLIFCYHKMDLPEAQANLEKAKNYFFSTSWEREFPTVAVETSIHQPESMEKLKQQFVLKAQTLK